MKVTILASGSHANCAVVTVGDVSIMIDAGLAQKDALPRMLRAGVSPESIRGVLITHVHGDHTNGLVAIADKLFDVPVFMSYGTAEKMRWPREARIRLSLFRPGASFDVAGIRVGSFGVPHDAPEACGFTLTSNGVRLAWATDLGEITPAVEGHLGGADVLILESNHDDEMLRVGPYPTHLKRRVAGPGGHLSNDAVADYLKRGLPGTSRVILTHLSEANNCPELCRLTALEALAGRCELQLAGAQGGLS